MIHLKEEMDKPLYFQIYKQIREEIILGKTPEGTKLPSTRTLAKNLNVSRNTVESAYLQLCAEGYIASKPCSGFIVEHLDNSLLSLKDVKAEEIVTSEIEGEEENYQYDFRYGRPSIRDFPLKIWRKLSSQCLVEENLKDLISYNEINGEKELKIEIVKYLNQSRGVASIPEQVIICSGIQHSLSLLCQLFRNHYTRVAFEEPGYDGARSVFINNGYDVIPIAVEENGISIEELEQCNAEIVYITPSHQFPTGAVMPIQKRVEVLDWARRKNAIIIEDDYDSELRYNSKPIPAIQGVDRNGCVIYIGTFSKCLAPGLRLNYMVLPEQWLKEYNEVFKRYHCSVPWIQQKILQQFMKLGYWEGYLRKICTSYRRKHDVLIQTIEELMGDHVTIHGRNAGLHIILEFHHGLSEEEAIKRARKYKIKVYPVSTYWMRLEKSSKNKILLGFGGMSEKEIAEGVLILNQAWFGISSKKIILNKQKK